MKKKQAFLTCKLTLRKEILQRLNTANLTYMKGGGIADVRSHGNEDCTSGLKRTCLSENGKCPVVGV